MTYFGTTAQFISYAVSGLTVLVLIGVWFFEYRNRRKLKANAQKAGAVISAMGILIVLSLSSVAMVGCSNAYVPALSRTGSPEDEYLGSFSNPEDMVEYMKNRDAEKEKEEEEKREEEQKSLITVNMSSKGYDPEGKGFAVKIDESSGEQVISVITGRELAESGEEGYVEKESPYGSLIYDETERLGEPDMDTESLLINEADVLLSLEIYHNLLWEPELEKNAVKVAGRILNDAKAGRKSAHDKYNYSAVLAKASYVLADWDKTEEAMNLAEELFEEAETDAQDNGEPVASRVFAAAELYRLTGLKTYRSVVDAALMDTIPEGFSYDEPGYYGLFTYLMSDNQGNYKVSSSMMNYIFEKANSIIKEDFETKIISLRTDDNLKSNEEKILSTFTENSKLIAMADYISTCVEYRDYIEKVICFSCGANISGNDYTQEGEVLFNEPMFFVYGSLATDGERLNSEP